MSRLREFDLNEALEKAARLFWIKGYENTSVSELLREMNILNGSFYNAFKDKKNLYLQALKYYNRVITAERMRAFEENEDIRKAVRDFFRVIFTSLKNHNNPNGCLMTNSLTEEVLVHRDLRNYIESEISNFEVYVSGRIREAIDRKEIHPAATADQLASLIVTYLQGVFRLSNLGVAAEKLEEQTDYFLTGIGF